MVCSPVATPWAVSAAPVGKVASYGKVEGRTGDSVEEHCSKYCLPVLDSCPLLLSDFPSDPQAVLPLTD